MIPFWLGLAGVATSRAPLFCVETELSACCGPCCRGPQSKSSLMWITSVLFTFELLQSLLGERSENVVRSHKRSQFTDETELVHFKHGSPDADPEAQGSTRIPPSALAWEQGVTPQPGQPYSGRTIWIRKLKTPLREFLRTETGGALVLFLRRSLRLCGSTSTPLPTTRFGG